MADSAPNTPTAPLTDLGQELGILFAFSFFMISSLVAYWVGWKKYVKRVSKIERGRQAELSGTQLYRDHADEKAGVQQRDKVPT